MEPVNVGKKISLLRKNNNVTQKELASFLHVTDKAVSRWESGAGNPDIETLPLIASFFNVSIDYLLSDKNETDFSAETKNKAPEKEEKKKIHLKEFLFGTRKRMLLFISLCCAVVLAGSTVGIILGVREFNRGKTYSNAISLMENGKYSEAIKRFEEIKDYRDSSRKINVCFGLIDVEYSYQSGEYASFKSGIKLITDAKECISITYDGNGTMIKDSKYQFSETITYSNPNVFEPVSSTFVKWNVVSYFYLKNTTNIFAKAQWSN